jgi:hypothetical protein
MGSVGIAPSILNVVGDESLALRYGHFDLGKRARNMPYSLHRKLSGPQSRAGLGGKETILCPSGNRNLVLRSSSRWPIHCIDRGAPALTALFLALIKYVNRCQIVYRSKG